jgi:hypothetical protein
LSASVVEKASFTGASGTVYSYKTVLKGYSAVGKKRRYSPDGFFEDFKTTGEDAKVNYCKKIEEMKAVRQD